MYDKLLAEANNERELGSLDKAVGLYQQIINDKPNDLHVLVHAYLGLAKTYQLLNQESPNLGYLEKMSEQVEKSSELLNRVEPGDQILILENLAEVAMLHEEFDKAYSLWDDLLINYSLGSGYKGRAYTHRAQALYKLGKHDVAEVDAQKAIEMLTKAKSEDNLEEYTWKVWYSGALMTLWKIVSQRGGDEKSDLEAKIDELLQDERLKNRRRQWTELLQDSS